MITILSLCHLARMPAWPEANTVVIRLRPHDRAHFRSACDDASIDMLIQFMLDVRAFEWVSE